MALNATIYKVSLNIADLDRQYFADHALTLAQHPSETDLRLMVRILAYGFEAEEHLSFGRGISTADEPDMWQKSLTGDIEHWIDVGLPSLERLKKACGRSRRVTVYAYGDRQAPIWFEQIKNELPRFDTLTVYSFSNQSVQSLLPSLSRVTQLQMTIQDQEALVSSEKVSVTVTRDILFASDR
ncbi:YaeQ family protein [Gynuella sunshinyii]|uniref:YaeQ protein n=1 Tax=Gynuella sunshinyii YC6258 TaxID=1445510 RepID=A0A0C5V099_9GAMM|nr:YaeQ family protein [Gynuella sunshinyii]AJQ92995.1 hypothetical protein YC6258_00945 [Gynuella sunshinyii YC6258]